MEHIYRVAGRVVLSDGSPARDVVVALVDEDVVLDDLLGVGVTGADGAFRLSCRSARRRRISARSRCRRATGDRPCRRSWRRRAGRRP